MTSRTKREQVQVVRVVMMVLKDVRILKSPRIEQVWHRILSLVLMKQTMLCILSIIGFLHLLIQLKRKLIERIRLLKCLEEACKRALLTMSLILLFNESSRRITIETSLIMLNSSVSAYIITFSNLNEL